MAFKQWLLRLCIVGSFVPQAYGARCYSSLAKLMLSPLLGKPVVVLVDTTVLKMNTAWGLHWDTGEFTPEEMYGKLVSLHNATVGLLRPAVGVPRKLISSVRKYTSGDASVAAEPKELKTGDRVNITYRTPQHAPEQAQAAQSSNLLGSMAEYAAEARTESVAGSVVVVTGSEFYIQEEKPILLPRAAIITVHEIRGDLEEAISSNE